MSPPARRSIKFCDSTWSIGSQYICGRCQDASELPGNTIHHWQDGDGYFLYLYRRASPLQEEDIGQPVTGLQLSTRNCVFELTTGTLVKVKPWEIGLQLEGSAIDWVNKNFRHVPTTSKIYEWVDYEWSRSFLVMKKAQGSLLSELWPKLTKGQRKDVARQVAEFIEDMSMKSSTMLETVDGFGVQNAQLVGFKPYKVFLKGPKWKPHIHPRFTWTEFQAHLHKESGMQSPVDTGEFRACHPDLHPSNIFVEVKEDAEAKEDAEVRVTALIDWELFAYWPDFWIATCPDIWRFHPGGLSADGPSWSELLVEQLTNRGFSEKQEWHREFRNEQEKLRKEAGGEEYANFLRQLLEEHRKNQEE